jgi:hypothetical protein
MTIGAKLCNARAQGQGAAGCRGASCNSCSHFSAAAAVSGTQHQPDRCRAAGDHAQNRRQAVHATMRWPLRLPRGHTTHPDIFGTRSRAARAALVEGRARSKGWLVPCLTPRSSRASCPQVVTLQTLEASDRPHPTSVLAANTMQALASIVCACARSFISMPRASSVHIHPPNGRRCAAPHRQYLSKHPPAVRC